MSLSKVSNLYTIPLQPGVNPFNFPGRHFTLVESPVPVRVKLGNMPDVTLSAGNAIAFDAPDTFDRFEITNPLDAVLRIRFWAGYVAFQPNVVNQIEAPTSFEAVADFGDYVGGHLAAHGHIDLVGTVSAGKLRRKAVQVSNLSPEANILLCTIDPTRAVITAADLAAANGTYVRETSGRWPRLGDASYWLAKDEDGRWHLYHDDGEAITALYSQTTAGHEAPWSAEWAATDDPEDIPTVAQWERVGLVVRPGETLTQPVSGVIRVKNDTGSAVACWLSEIWWTQ